MNFQSERNGYNKKEVEKYINDTNKLNQETFDKQKERINELKKEIESLENRLNKYKQKDSNISDALVAAVETARKIEQSSKNIYDLEIRRVRALYDKWDNFLSEMLDRYPKLKSDFDPKTILKAFEDGINEVMSLNNAEIENKSYEYGGGIRNLINKMNNVTTTYSQPSLKTQPKDGYTITRNPRPQTSSQIEKEIEDEYYFETKRMDKDSIIKPILNLKEDKSSLGNYENAVDKFLDEDLTDMGDVAYSNAIFNKTKKDSGFDLREALTPTEDLEDIMKSFDIQEGKKKK